MQVGLSVRDRPARRRWADGRTTAPHSILPCFESRRRRHRIAARLLYASSCCSAPRDRVVLRTRGRRRGAEGRLVPRTLLKIVQPADAGVSGNSREEGMAVVAGQPVLRLDARLADADLRAHRLGSPARAAACRLDAELEAAISSATPTIGRLARSCIIHWPRTVLLTPSRWNARAQIARIAQECRRPLRCRRS